MESGFAATQALDCSQRRGIDRAFVAAEFEIDFAVGGRRRPERPGRRRRGRPASTETSSRPARPRRASRGRDRGSRPGPSRSAARLGDHAGGGRATVAAVGAPAPAARALAEAAATARRRRAAVRRLRPAGRRVGDRFGVGVRRGGHGAAQGCAAGPPAPRRRVRRARPRRAARPASAVLRALRASISARRSPWALSAVNRRSLSRAASRRMRGDLGLAVGQALGAAPAARAPWRASGWRRAPCRRPCRRGPAAAAAGGGSSSAGPTAAGPDGRGRRQLGDQRGLARAELAQPGALGADQGVVGATAVRRAASWRSRPAISAAASAASARRRRARTCSSRNSACRRGQLGVCGLRVLGGAGAADRDGRRTASSESSQMQAQATASHQSR